MVWKKAMAAAFICPLFIVSACTAGGASSIKKESEADSSASRSQELIVYTVNTKNQELLQELFKPFEEKNHAKIKLIATESNKFIENFMAAHNGKQPIDVVELNGQDVRFMATSGIIKDLSGVATYKDRFLKAAMDPFILDGKTYAVPVGSISTSALYYNKKILEKYGLKPPVTYQDILNTAASLKADNISTVGFGGGTAYMWPMWFFQAFAQTSGNQSVERTFDTLRGKAKFTDADYTAAMKMLERFGKDGIFQPGVNGIDTKGGLAVFSTGKSAMFYGGSWEYPGFLKAAVDSGGKFDVGIVTFPLMDNNQAKPQATGGSGSALGIYSGISAQKESLAQKFIEFYSSDDIQQQYLTKTNGTFSVNVSVKGTLQDPITKAFQETYLPQTVTFLDWYWPPEITKAFQENIQAVVGGQKPAEQAMADIQKVQDGLVAKGYQFDQKAK
ncbi:ABC transporter substrate-binding protein [Paenibacillus piri]|uniref:Extracellular solute-binding protein n=1 Tax=Paenibacillus piri TaxID=2547395 RepID=A0A4R5KHG5_9BACL|nr:extracellular solute-binding protein [Paenibacillus piri]TDF94843.1 extracellular solute-binding protein [Paenibacillus piri]